MIRGISLLVMWMLLVGFSVPADAQVLCTNPSGLVFVRTQCKGNEIQLDPVTLGLVDDLLTRVETLEAKLACMTKIGDNVFFDACNVHIRSGSGDTFGAVNGTGNLIIGYNENDGSDTKSGSHNLVIGADHTYTSYGGLVAGFNNAVTGTYASVSGGQANLASGFLASVSGGEVNHASGTAASVSGGRHNVASAASVSVSGGQNNLASSTTSSVSWGARNTASGGSSSVSGGQANEASNNFDSVVGDLNQVFVDATMVH